MLLLSVELTDRTILVAGGGNVAEQKVRTLLAQGADVLLVAPQVTAELDELANADRIRRRVGVYDASDLEGVFLAVAATDNKTVNRRIAEDARKCGILVAVADAPELSSCHFPAILQRGNLKISVSTGGECPAFAAAFRDHLAGLVGDEYGAALEQVAAMREKLLTEGKGTTYNKKLLRSLAHQMISELNKHKGQP